MTNNKSIIIFTVVLFYCYVSSVQGRILTKLNLWYGNSNTDMKIFVASSPAPYDDIGHTIDVNNYYYELIPSPSYSHNVNNYGVAPSPISVHNASTIVDHYKLAPSPSNYSHNVNYSVAPSPSSVHNESTVFDHYKLAPSPSNYSHCVNFSVPPSPSVNKSSIIQGSIVYDIRSLGAVGDGLTDDTVAFKSAWDRACLVEDATILAPRGYTFLLQPMIFTGPCKSGLVFQVEGTIVPPDGPNSWPKKMSRRQWLIFYRTHGLSFQGNGLIDGRGNKWWNLPCKPHKGVHGTTLPGPCDSPVAIRFFGTKNLTVKGLRIINSPQFHIRIDACQSVSVDSLDIKSPYNSPNTDGIHVENTIDIKIHNSVISNGDDCISIGAGTHNMEIKNVTCGPSHGISIGSLGMRNSRACVSDITVTNCLIKNSDNGVRIKTWQGGSGSVSNINFNGIRMDMVRNPIMIDQYYCNSRRCRNQTSAVSIASITFNNIKGTYDTRSPPLHLGCSDSVPCTNITISGLELIPASVTVPIAVYKRGSAYSLMDPFCWKAYGTLGAFAIPPVNCLLAGLPYLGLPRGDARQC